MFSIVFMFHVYCFSRDVRPEERISFYSCTVLIPKAVNQLVAQLYRLSVSLCHSHIWNVIGRPITILTVRHRAPLITLFKLIVVKQHAALNEPRHQLGLSMYLIVQYPPPPLEQPKGVLHHSPRRGHAKVIVISLRRALVRRV